MTRGYLSGQNAGSADETQDIDQPVHILVPQIDFGANVDLHGISFGFYSALPGTLARKVLLAVFSTAANRSPLTARSDPAGERSGSAPQVLPLELQLWR
jgi:hypothetical protein